MKRLMILIACLNIVVRAFAENQITISSVEATAGSEVTIRVSMANTDPVSAIQLSIPLSDNLSFVENSQKAGDRLSEHTLSVGVNDGVLNVMAYSNSMSAISGNEGDICSFKLLLGNNPGVINLITSKASLSGCDGTSIDVSVTGGYVDIRGAKIKFDKNTLDFGRIGINELSTRSILVKNVGNETLTITDVTFSATIFSIEKEWPISIDAGSSIWLYVNCRAVSKDLVDEVMTIVSNNPSGNSTIRLTATPYSVNELGLGNVAGITDEEVAVPIIMNNMDVVNGFQMEINLPDGLEYVDGSFTLSNRKQDHVATASVADGILCLVAYSPTDKSFNGSEGEVGSFKVKIIGGSNVSMNVEKAILSSTFEGNTSDVLSSKYGCTVYVKSPNMYVWSSFNFGDFSINEQNIERSFTIRNRGEAPLIISKITFDNGLFRVKEDLPLTIEPESEKAITIVCVASNVDGDISTTMELYTNDPQKRLFMVTVTGSILTPDYLMGTVEANRIGVKLNVSLNNYSNIYGIQFDINTATSFYASVDNICLTERGNNLSVSINPISEEIIRVVAYAQNNQYVNSGDGDIMTIKLVPKEVMPEGDHILTISNILLGSETMQNKYSGDDFTIGYSVNGVIPGDANKDGKLGIGDIIAIVNIIAGKVDGYDVEAADANQDNQVNTEDIDTIVSFMAGK